MAKYEIGAKLHQDRALSISVLVEQHWIVNMGPGSTGTGGASGDKKPGYIQVAKAKMKSKR